MHTTKSMMRANDAITTLPQGAGEDFKSDSEHTDSEFESEGVEEGPSTSKSLPSWIYSNQIQVGDVNKEIIAQYKKAMAEPQTDNSTRNLMLSIYKDNLKMHRLQFLQQQFDTRDVQGMIQQVMSRKKI